MNETINAINIIDPINEPINAIKITTNDPINPAHYKAQCSMECIDTMIIGFGVEATIDYCMLCAYKYLWRLEHKDTKEINLEKAKWYIDKARMLNEDYKQYVHRYLDNKEKIYMLSETYIKFV